MTRLFQYGLGIAVLFTGAAARNVGAADNSSEQDYLQEFPVVLSASRLMQPLSEAPNAMTVIDRKMIVASGFRKIPDLFKLVPGMYVSYYKGSQAIVTYHGATDQYSRRMQVLVDGRSVYMPPNNTVDWEYLPFTIDDIERIEVIRGPAAASYGANSTQGVINIITIDAGVDKDRKVSVTHGTAGVSDVTVNFGKRGEAFDYRTTLAYTNDNGYDSLSEPPNHIPITTVKADGLLNNSYDNNLARLMNYRGNYHPNMVDSLDVQFGFKHDVQEVGFIDKNPTSVHPNSTNGNPPHNLISNSSFMQTGWTHILENASELNVKYYHIQENQQEALPVYLSGTLYPGPVIQTLNVSRDSLELQHTTSIVESNRVVYGGNYQRNLVKGQSLMSPLALYLSSIATFENFQLFANDEWRINKEWLVNIGEMFEKDSVGHKNWSPRASLNFHATPEQALRVGISYAYRTPALTETHTPLIQPGALLIPSNVASAADLKPEKMVSREIGYSGNFPDGRILLDFRLFKDQLSNGITPNPATLVFSNGLSAEYHGWEATLKKAWGETSDITVNVAHIFASSNSMALAASGNNYFASSPTDILADSLPEYSGSLLYSLHLNGGYVFNASYYYQDSLQPLDRGPIDFQPVQHRTDIRIARTYHGANGITGELAMVVQNLFNTDYTEYISSNVFKRRIFAKFTLSI
jgi:iron complex outermembrane receptor protein